MRRLIPFLLLLLLAPLRSHAINLADVRWHSMATDTTRINQLLTRAQLANLTTNGDRMAWFGRQLLDKPYVAHTLECDGEEMLTINIDELDCTTLVETCMALAVTAGQGHTSWRDFVDNLETIRYRGGELDGYPSRLHYISDWANENAQRDILREVSSKWPKVNYLVKTIDFMSRNRDKYPALADSTIYERILSTESGYRSYRFPYLKSADLLSKDMMQTFRNGDIVAFVTKTNGLDVSHLGMIVMENGKPRLLHASYSGKRVMIDPLALPDYLRRSRNLLGVRVFRLVND